MAFSNQELAYLDKLNKECKDIRKAMKEAQKSLSQLL